MDVKRYFLDTNIILRALLADADHHQPIDALLKRLLADDAELWISGQIIREFIVQATHPRTLKNPLSMADAIQNVKIAEQLFLVADNNVAVRNKLLQLLTLYPTGGKQVHDANVVATMLGYGITTLITLNIADFQRFAPEIEIITLPIP